MAGTNAARLRRPIVRRGISGMVGPPRAVTVLEDAITFAKHTRHKQALRNIAPQRLAFPMVEVQRCIDASVNGAEVEECLLGSM